jgi:hypothetical protein
MALCSLVATKASICDVLMFSSLGELAPAWRLRCSNGRVGPPETYRSLARDKLWTMTLCSFCISWFIFGAASGVPQGTSEAVRRACPGTRPRRRRTPGTSWHIQGSRTCQHDSSGMAFHCWICTRRDGSPPPLRTICK